MKIRALPPQPAVQNQLIARLGVSERRRLLAHCEMVQLQPAEALSDPGVPMHHVYFPVRGVSAAAGALQLLCGRQAGNVMPMSCLERCSAPRPPVAGHPG
jgi:hypothetical protein